MKKKSNTTTFGILIILVFFLPKILSFGKSVYSDDLPALLEMNREGDELNLVNVETVFEKDHLKITGEFSYSGGKPIRILFLRIKKQAKNGYFVTGGKPRFQVGETSFHMVLVEDADGRWSLNVFSSIDSLEGLVPLSRMLAEEEWRVICRLNRIKILHQQLL